MKYLKENGYYTASIEELEAFMEGKLKLPKKTVVITFDDGYLSNAIYAYPIMKEYEMKGAIFSIGELATREKKEFEPQGLQFISLEDMEKYKDVFLFGSHTYDLHHKNEQDIAFLKSLSKEEILNDLVKNIELLDSRYIAYPFGEYNKDAIKYVKEAGYKLGFTVRTGYVSRYTRKYKIPRIIISQDIDLDKFISFLK
ncbi:Peptidoglycan/xylan/chitin deacetylase, PgdA/CDA1 family [Tissierella praeacuta DSM 18095]|uniref:Peptidoglycan/xylan/chitin deacetylase, PgdA/CDA1 family n=1 Tax=Tissierella praeacuta DSM 18095 TaxID=1123404 RepID=A0A1M4UYH9_9FIRM|nr:polysaccharide deacetylase family protein [Tissierella praeacuta]TCU73989.1 peptidoglycan/xylan/chitin deacetylase (PgdA/CDA1 family) [Tissierella praeacuta]SHE61786.1 Peptidoglycan/xylan/chitin deacetylase, PgdA/CDA1 family [Tissierella praeacuta DSM 18095]SUP02705.1 Poly-beta-1,6-N-acetyl-D-glucosamine N-deacetylase precursor [Tissierella praeacuta]